MAAFNFPNSPSTNDLHTENSVTWKWNGTVWKRVNNSYLTASTLNITGISTFGGVVKIPAVAGTNNAAWQNVLHQNSAGVIDGGSGLQYHPANDQLSVNGTTITSGSVYSNGGSSLKVADANYSSTTYAQLSNKVEIAVNDNVAGAFKLKEGTNEYITVDTTNSSELIKFGTAAQERLRIDSGGRVLINRTNNDAPGGYASKLQIRDTTYTASISLVRNDPGGGGPTLVFGKSRNATQSDATVVQSGDTLGQIDFYGADGTDINSAGAQIVAQVDGTPGGNDMPGRLIFKTTADGAASTTERLRITSDGKVSIGTGTPRQLLHLNVGDSGAANIVFTNTGTGTAAGDGFILGITGNEDAQLWHQENKPIRFATNNSERLRITEGGHVLFSGVTTNNDTRNSSGITVKSSSGISFLNYGSNGSRNWRIRPDDLSAWGSLEFSVSPTDNSSTDWPDASTDVVLELKKNKDVKIHGGNLIIGTSGKGIDFSATGHTNPTGDGEVLTTYEEGVWTPQPMFGGANTGMAFSADGYYVRVGKMVTCYYQIIFTNKGSATGTFSMGGFPFSNSATEFTNPGWGYFHRLSFSESNDHLVTCNLSGTTSTWRRAQYGSGVHNMNSVTNSNFNSSTHIAGSLIYRCS